MYTQSSELDSKYRKQALINRTIDIKCYVDFGSDVTLISKDVVEANLLTKSENDLPNIRGSGNFTYIPLGKTRINLALGDVSADIDAYIVDPSLLIEPMLVGQNFTEVLVVKTCDRLDILKRDLPKDLACLLTETESNDRIVLRIKTDTNVEKFDYIGCSGDRDLNCDIFVENSVRTFENVEYCVMGGLYSMNEGECKVATCNLSETTLPLGKNIVLTRAKIITPARIGDQLDMLNGNKYYSSLDLVSGYYHIPIHADYRHLTAFITPAN